MQWTEEHHALRETVRDLVEKEVQPHVDAWERAGCFPAHELFGKLGAAGLLGLEYEEEYGGGGVDHSFSVVVAEELGRIDCAAVPMAIAVQTGMATPSLAALGTPAQKREFLAPAIAGTAVCSIAVSEAGAGSDVAGIRTRARRDGDEWVVDGSKMWITNGTQADWVCLLARTSEEGGHRGMSQLLVRTDTPGFTVSRRLDKLGNHASDTAELAFTEMRVPVRNTLGEIGRGFQQQMAQFVVERMVACYGQVTALQQALDRTRDYLRERHVFGRPVIANQHVAFRLAELAAELDLARHYNYAMAQAYVRGEDVTRMATIGKLKLGRLSREVADTCLQYHGGAGYLEDTWTARFFRDRRLTSIGGGADEVMLQVLAGIDGYTP